MMRPRSTIGIAFATAFALGALLTAQPRAFAQAGEGQTCGGVDGPKCSTGFLCESPDAACTEDNPVGTCIVRTEACTKIYKPVCGCDGKTYANDCTRIAAAARKAHDGECKPESP